MSKLGMDGKLKIATVEAVNVRQVTISLEATQVDASRRATGGWKAYEYGLKDATVEAVFVKVEGDAQRAALISAWLGKTAVAIDANDGTKGISGDFIVASVALDQPLDDVMTDSFTLKPTFSTAAPVVTA